MMCLPYQPSHDCTFFNMHTAQFSDDQVTPVFQVKALVSLDSGGVPTAYLSSQQTLREKRGCLYCEL